MSEYGQEGVRERKGRQNSNGGKKIVWEGRKEGAWNGTAEEKRQATRKENAKQKERRKAPKDKNYTENDKSRSAGRTEELNTLKRNSKEKKDENT